MRELLSGLVSVCVLFGCGGKQQVDLPEPLSPRSPGTETVERAEKGAAEGAEVETTRVVVPKSLLDAKQLAEGWIQLFDGHSLFGWQANSEANWSVREGVIHSDSGPAGLLVTSVPFADYELLCDFRLAAGGNSGVFLRTAVTPVNPALDCYE
ncbi:MAG: DUF1080 domain-containing protein, partial [Planctomycetaceae bacterium]